MPKLCLLAAAIVLGLLAPGHASAQEASTKTLDAVTVTGSRIKRTDVETALPITIIQKADIEAHCLRLNYGHPLVPRTEAALKTLGLLCGAGA